MTHDTYLPGELVAFDILENTEVFEGDVVFDSSGCPATFLRVERIEKSPFLDDDSEFIVKVNEYGEELYASLKTYGLRVEQH